LARHETNRRIGYPAPGFLPRGDNILEIIVEVPEAEVDGGYSAALRGYGIHYTRRFVRGDPLRSPEALAPYCDDAVQPLQLIPRRFPDDEAPVA